MSEAKVYFERHSLALAMQTYLAGEGWTDISKVEEGFPFDNTIHVPMVSIYFLPSLGIELQMGRDGRSFAREIQVEVYMESEPRAMAIVDDIADFIDLTTVSITKPDSSVLGVIYNPDTEKISTNTVPPLLTDPKVKRWRGYVRASLQADYLND